jgi:4-hydroxy-tetrahydrodipicolinate synthase
MNARFGNVLTAMVTPFDDNGALDLDAARDLARWLVENGNQGLVVTGTTGEAPAKTKRSACGRRWPRP